MEQIATAEITTSAPEASGLSLHAHGAYELDIGRVGFVRGDLRLGVADSVVDRKPVDNTASLPEYVKEERTSGALTPGTAYRAFFHVYDRTGVNLVACDRCDFIWQ